MSSEIEIKFDHENQVIKKPAGFKGTYDEFVYLVGRLEPHHCSYPSGRCIDKRTGAPCRRAKTFLDGCRPHAKRKAAKGLRYAKYLDARLGARMAEAHIDDELLNIGHDVGFLSVRFSQLLERLDTGESRDAWVALKAQWGEILEAQKNMAIAEKDKDAVSKAKHQAESVNAIKKIGSIITASASNETTWDEAMALSERIAILKTKETVRRKDAGLTLNVEQAMSFVQQLSDIITEEVTDANARATIAFRMATILGIDNRQDLIPKSVIKAATTSPLSVSKDSSLPAIEVKPESVPLTIDELINKHVKKEVPNEVNVSLTGPIHPSGSDTSQAKRDDRKGDSGEKGDSDSVRNRSDVPAHEERVGSVE